ncbi:hypothetical protein CALCODRAFT_78103 [Calocera cornea HHB12733]|uniref:SAGA-associated factor 11 n=1 Tax=Calocera cornea HHB12733 TaxID=1353952 RepID=A0A165DH62_9BASI|nr:hypothetical protein CALCODRAFT_78103 [Calocera cornea HHB12733]
MADVNREDLKKALAEKIFSTMLNDLIMDTVLLAHKENRKRQAKEHAYSKLRREGLVQDVQFSGSAPGSLSSSQSAADDVSTIQSNGGGGGTQKQDPALLDCLNCKRPIAFNRYAPHLASCMGLSVGSRRGQPRNASKRWLPVVVSCPDVILITCSVDSEGARSASPQVFGEDRESTPSGSKSNMKRNRSPSENSVRDAKRHKSESGRTTPQPRLNGTTGLLPGHYANSVPKASSKLRSSPVGSQGVPASPGASVENGYESDYMASQQQSILSDSNSLSQPSADLYEGEDKDPEYVIDVDGTVDTESDSDSGSE